MFYMFSKQVHMMNQSLVSVA